MEIGQRLLEAIRAQRKTYECLTDGSKRIFNPIAYYAFEDEILDLQKKIGRENKKSLRKELGSRGCLEDEIKHILKSECNPDEESRRIKKKYLTKHK